MEKKISEAFHGDYVRDRQTMYATPLRKGRGT